MPQSTGTDEKPAEKLYTIGAVSKMTGVGAVTLRAWERRHGLIEPTRKESGHRLYTMMHIDQIKRITALTRQGIRISQIRPEMLESDLPKGETPDAARDDAWKEYFDGMLAAVVRFDEDRLEEVYNAALSLYPIWLVTEKLLRPLLVELGRRWECGEGTIAEEHFFVFCLRHKLGARYHHRQRGNDGPLLLLAGLPGEHHEIGLLLFALAAHESGYRLIPLGANMPLPELADVARQKNCQAIVLSGAIELSPETLKKDLPALVQSAEIPVLIGGQASVTSGEAIARAGAGALGRDIERGLRRMAELIGPRRSSP